MINTTQQGRWILPVIVLSQFCCTSLWFAGNAVMADLAHDFHAGKNALAHLTTAVQLGFIAGTLVFALLSIADRYSPSKVFLVCAVTGAAFNVSITLLQHEFTLLMVFRVCTGFFLAGIYPVGMKIAADHFEKGLGKSLGFLVGALVLGTAFPHLLRGFTQALPWRMLLLYISALAVFGGLLMRVFVADGPYRKPKLAVDLSAIPRIFRNKELRAAAFGYFGHMWELYAFWAFVPVMLSTYKSIHPGSDFGVSLASFFIIGVGSIACAVAGKVSVFTGTKRTAFTALMLSGACCLLSPLAFGLSSEFLFISFLLFWGMVVIADSPLFSTLVALHAPPEIKGTALTITNSIGFAITIISIQLVGALQPIIEPRYLFLVLAAGPLLGLIAGNKKNILPGKAN